MLAQVREGKLLALAVTSRARVPVLPEVPTVAEAAIPGYESSTWYGFLAPARTARAVREQLARHLREISEEKEVKEKFAAQGIFPRSIELEDFDSFIREDVARLGALAKAVGAKAN
jgi:tripartite-type tricarboxylate transporter receptor subunit TctC